MTSQRRLAGVIVYVLQQTSSGNRVLFLKRSDERHLGSWWPVAGKPEPGESGLTTALRELHEETGLSPLRVLDFGMEIPHADPECRLETFVAIVDADCVVQLNYEHSDYRWVDGNEAVALVPEHSRIYLNHLRSRFVENDNLV